jgi:hypothetical protein
MASPALLDGAENEAAEVPTPVVQRGLLDQIEVGRILEHSLMIHAGGLLSIAHFRNFQTSMRAEVVGIGF